MHYQYLLGLHSRIYTHAQHLSAHWDRPNVYFQHIILVFLRQNSHKRIRTVLKFKSGKEAEPFLGQKNSLLLRENALVLSYNLKKIESSFLETISLYILYIPYPFHR